MDTKIVTSPQEAAAYITSGTICAFPTETVYGLGASAFSPPAIRHIFEAKGRPSDNPLIVHVALWEQVESLVSGLPAYAEILADRFFPGPLTLVLPRHPNVPEVVSGGLPTIGVRMPDHPVAREFLTACSVPVAAPSANRSGKPSPTTWEAVYADLKGRIPCILKSDQTPLGLESTVVDCTGAFPVILRHGSISYEDLVQVVPTTNLQIHDKELLARSPGTRYRHYAPRARVILIDDPREIQDAETSSYIGIINPQDSENFLLVQICPTENEYGRRLFDFFRRSDEAGSTRIYCQRVAERGIGRAIMDRIRRASGADVT